MADDTDLHALDDFLHTWLAIVNAGEKSIAAHTPGDEAEWAHLRQVGNRAFGGVRHLLSAGTVRDFSGEHDAFDYVLANVAQLSWLVRADSQRPAAFRQAASIGTAAIERARGRLIERTSHPAIEDEADLLASRTGVDKFLDDLRTAERRLRDEDWRDAVHSARAAFEICVKQVANRLVLTTSERSFANAVEVCEQRGLIDSPTAKAWTGRDVGLYGWLSNRGSHREDGGTDLVVGKPEAQYAFDWARSSIIYLLQKTSAIQDG